MNAGYRVDFGAACMDVVACMAKSPRVWAPERVWTQLGCRSSVDLVRHYQRSLTASSVAAQFTAAAMIKIRAGRTVVAGVSGDQPAVDQFSLVMAADPLFFQIGRMGCGAFIAAATVVRVGSGDAVRASDSNHSAVDLFTVFEVLGSAFGFDRRVALHQVPLTRQSLPLCS